MRFDTSSRSEPRSAVSILVRLLAQPVTLALVFVLALTEQAAEATHDGAELLLALILVFELIFQFA